MGSDGMDLNTIDVYYVLTLMGWRTGKSDVFGWMGRI